LRCLKEIVTGLPAFSFDSTYFSINSEVIMMNFL
jgi:hypothetical protein